MIIILSQVSCGALLNCESRHAWDRKYNDGLVYQKCLSYRDKEEDQWYDRLFGF
jgi:hypothetical protein